MKRERIYEIVVGVINDYCKTNGIEVEELNEHTALMGRNRILDSMGLVNVLVDVETAFLDEDIEITLTSEVAMSSRISPFHRIGSLCELITKQIEGVDEN